ncbi:(+)-neomenthol dehydrogenase [Turnera subulata]|uniref:(+)-neomenthol dehydrogenase n=1 Tax=Turnera subulata TaxID=218843 RepID=A0A9Q0J7J5_9ROSI|nr:(+)-neomenthol dehydrogenase [Turnera subulata]
MAQASSDISTKRYAVVTGSNQGIGFEICRQLASHGNITVILTARDPTRVLEAVQKLKEFGLSEDLLVFHQLDVGNPDSIASLAEFVKSKYGKLDILVNNAGVSGIILDPDAFRRAGVGSLEAKGWPTHLSAYKVSKVALNAYTRVLAKRYPGESSVSATFLYGQLLMDNGFI